MASPALRRRRALIRAVVASAVSIAILLLVWRALGHSVAWQGVHLSAVPVVLAAAGAFTFLVGRAWRFHLFLPRRQGSAADLLGVTAASWGAGLLLPGPSADVAFVAFARSRLGVGVARATGVAVIARVLDVVSLCLVAVLAAFVTVGGQSKAVVISAAVVGVAGLVGLGVLIAARPRRALLRVAARIRRLAPFAARVDNALDELGTGPTWFGLALSTGLCRLATALQYSALFALLGLNLGFWQVWFVLSIRTLLFTVPIQGIAGIGTGQAWWAGGLLLVGVGVGTAVPAGITLQAIDLAVSLPVAGLAALTLLRRRRAVADAKDVIAQVGSAAS